MNRLSTLHATTSPFYIIGGTLPPTATSYIMRQADWDLQDALKQGEFCYVLTSRQKGKSSLMSRMAAQLRTEGTAVAEIDLTGIGQNLTQEQWYDGLVYELGKALGLHAALQACWSAHESLGPLHRFLIALREGVLGQSSASIVIFVDEIEIVRSLPFSTDEFFAAIRDVYNRRATDAEWKRLTFCLLGMATPTDLIQNPQITPFNIGRRIELHDFMESEAAPLAKGLPGGRFAQMRILRRILYWTNGHPYLTQRLCQAVASEPGIGSVATVDKLCASLFFTHEARNTETHLMALQDYLLRCCPDSTDLLDLYRRVLTARHVGNADTRSLRQLLLLSGIVRGTEQQLTVRNRIYARVFDVRWVDAQLPAAEILRQRRAYRLGMARTAAWTGTLLLLLGSLTGLLWTQTQRLRTAQQETTGQLAVTRKLLYAARIQQSSQALKDHNVAHAVNLLAENRNNPLRRFEYDYLWGECHRSQKIVSLENARVYAVALSPKGSLLAVGDSKGYVTVYARSTGKPQASLGPFPYWIGELAFSPRGDVLAVGGEEGAIHLWDTVTWNEVRVLKSPGKVVSRFIFTEDGMNVIAGYYGGLLLFWRLADGRATQLISRSSLRINSIALSPNNHLLAAADTNGIVQLWNLKTRSLLQVLTGYGTTATATFSPREGLLAVGSQQGTISLIDPFSGKQQKILRGSSRSIVALAFAPHERFLASGHKDGTIELWEMTTDHAQPLLGEHTRSVSDMVFTEDNRLFSGSHDGSVRQWKINVATTEEPLLPPGAVVLRSSQLSLDAEMIATRDDRGMIALWKRGKSTPLWTRSLPMSEAPLAFMPTRRALLVADLSGKLHLAALETGHDAGELSLSQTPITALAVSPDGQCFARALSDKKIEIWNLSTGRLLRTLSGHNQTVRTLAFSADGQLLASGGLDKTVRIWTVLSEKAPQILQGHGASVLSVAFSPDGTRIVSGDANACVKLWDLSTGCDLLTLTGPASPVMGVAFDRKGTSLSAQYDTGVLHCWKPRSP